MKTLQAPDESEETITFDKSLKELRELSSQLHYSADYCSSTFLRTREKKIAVENTREYICRAMVTVVDHLGNVSANLDIRLNSFDRFAEAEFRIHTLKQKLQSCEDYVSKLALTGTRWNPVLPKFCSRYLIIRSDRGINESQDISPRDTKKGKLHATDKHAELNTEEGMPLFLYTETKVPSSAKNLTVKCAAATERKNTFSSIVPVSHGLSKPSKSQKPTLHFQSTKERKQSQQKISAQFGYQVSYKMRQMNVVKHKGRRLSVSYLRSKFK